MECLSLVFLHSISNSRRYQCIARGTECAMLYLQQPVISVSIGTTHPTSCLPYIHFVWDDERVANWLKLAIVVNRTQDSSSISSITVCDVIGFATNLPLFAAHYMLGVALWLFCLHGPESIFGHYIRAGSVLKKVAEGGQCKGHKLKVFSVIYPCRLRLEKKF